MVELIISITIFSLLFGMGALVLGNFMTNQALTYTGDRLSQKLREARSYAMAEYRDSDWGVYLDNTSNPNRFVMFKGNSYLLRDIFFDQQIELPGSVLFSSISLNEGGKEIVFTENTGRTQDYGDVFLNSQGDTYQVSVDEVGTVNYNF